MFERAAATDAPPCRVGRPPVRSKRVLAGEPTTVWTRNAATHLPWRLSPTLFAQFDMHMQSSPSMNYLWITHDLREAVPGLVPFVRFGIAYALPQTLLSNEHLG